MVASELPGFHEKSIQCELCNKTMTFRIKDKEEEPFDVRYYCRSCFKKMTMPDPDSETDSQRQPAR